MPNSKERAFDRAASGLAQLDALLQHRSRLGVMVLLSRAEALSFVRLRELLGETDGNLGAQLRQLEEKQYVSIKKEFVNRKPVTWYSMTHIGQAALKHHLDAMESLIQSANVDRFLSREQRVPRE